MEESLADQDGAITILNAGETGDSSGSPAEAMPTKRAATKKRSVSTSAIKTGALNDEVAPTSFYRDLVWNLRNGVLAITRDGRVAVMNDVAYRILGLKPRAGDIGQPYAKVLLEQPELTRIIAGAFDLSHLPNRAELRLKSSGKVIGYTLSQVRDQKGQLTGATLFFKDLTRVEQLEERERLRDRLAALGEMAAAIAHEVKNPLAGIEVMAGILKRQLLDNEDAQSILGDIIKEAKMANAIVLEVLEFVRPIRLQVERIALADVVRDAISLAEGHVKRGEVSVDVALPAELAAIQGDPYQLRQLFTNLITNAFEALNGKGAVNLTAVQLAEEEVAGSEGHTGPSIQVDVIDNGPGMPPDVMEKIFSPFFTTKPQGSGLGLAIVRKIVDAHDGQIDLRTSAGSGTLIRVTLPVDALTGL